jgi:hypothetical protein
MLTSDCVSSFENIKESGFCNMSSSKKEAFVLCVSREDRTTEIADFLASSATKHNDFPEVDFGPAQGTMARSLAFSSTALLEPLQNMTWAN